MENIYNYIMHVKTPLISKFQMTIIFLATTFLIPNAGITQNYRNPKAYIQDFGKNELHIKEALIEYSSTIINLCADSRTQQTLDELYNKLNKINDILIMNDIGIKGDTGLRDAFLRLNNNTITLIKNNTFKLNDFEEQSHLDISEILKNFTTKELEIQRYYSEIIAYENIKREFGEKYNIRIRSNNQKSPLEYNAYQSLIFYKINVLDEKLYKLLMTTNIQEIEKCMDILKMISEESLVKTKFYKDEYDDPALNDATIDLVNFMVQQNSMLVNLYKNYLVSLNNLIENKNKIEEGNNSVINNYNKQKNLFDNTFYNIQTLKEKSINRWYNANYVFLKNNLKFANSYESFTR